jgi:hypothetical protein
MNNIERLLSNIETRIKTTMIGSLARFEESFDHLWEEDTEKAAMYYNLWEQTRNNILNNGNNQLRAAIDELSDYLYNNVRVPNNKPKFENKYHYKLFFNNPDHKNNKGDRE